MFFSKLPKIKEEKTETALKWDTCPWNDSEVTHTQTHTQIGFCCSFNTVKYIELNIDI